MSTLLRLTAGRILFPTACAACGGPGETTGEISCFRGIDAGHVALGDRLALPIRLCYRCRRRRRWAIALGWLVGVPLSVLPTVLLVGWQGPIEQPNRWLPDWVVIAGFLLVIGWAALLLGWLRSGLPGLADRLSLGVSIASWVPASQEVVLRLARPELAAEIGSRADRERDAWPA